MEKLYLSVDLDFWNFLSAKSMIKVLEQIRDSGKLRIIVDNHKNLLPSIDKSRCTTIVNVDTHSDIFSQEDMEDYEKNYSDHLINCGNWANHVSEEIREHYIWMYPACHGHRCDYNGNGRLFYEPYSIGWEKLDKKSIRKFPNTLIEEANDIGISISYYWLRKNLNVDLVMELIYDVFGEWKQQEEFTGF